ncbi:MAG: hypothetical protein FWD45_01565 [Coriobacteriia bacterium]|nr:hypothetical protein [Coriobacteriia bacterium]
MKSNSALKLAITGLLIAVGIVIPMLSPFKIVFEPVSFTLASHVAIFVAMFISPSMAVAVAAGTAAGFFLGGFPIVIVFRAASHVVFSLFGAYWLRRKSELVEGGLALRLYSFVVGLVHALCELAVVAAFYFAGNVSALYYQKGFVLTVVLGIGLGTVIHSMVDFEIAYRIVAPLRGRIASLSSETA